MYPPLGERSLAQLGIRPRSFCVYSFTPGNGGGNATQRGSGVAFRIVWYDVWPYPVTGHRRRPDEESSHWYVQTRDGVWHPMMQREPRTSLTDVWGALQGKVH